MVRLTKFLKSKNFVVKRADKNTITASLGGPLGQSIRIKRFNDESTTFYRVRHRDRTTKTNVIYFFRNNRTMLKFIEFKCKK